MSYSIHLAAPFTTGGPEIQWHCPADIGNYTSNVSPMWTHALGYELADLKDRLAADALPDLQRAVAAMEADPDKYEAMGPTNGWGGYEGAHRYLRDLRDACATHPGTAIRIWC